MATNNKLAMAYSRPLKLWHSCMRTSLVPIVSTVLLASMVAVVSQAEAPSGDYRFELTHVDANRGLGIDELTRRAIERSRLRAATLYGGAASAASGPPPPILSPVYVRQDPAEYFMKFYIGNRREPTSAVADTGSNLIWVAEGECAKTRSPLPCSSDMCNHHANCHCAKTPNGKSSKCEYSIEYGGNHDTETRGVMYTDRLTFPTSRTAGNSLKTFENVAIGCSTAVHFKSSTINGIVGLGRGPQSLPGQLHFNKFSYCLNSYLRPDLPSWLLFRTVPDLRTGAAAGAAVATTGLRRNSRYKTWYFVDLEDISIDGTRLGITLRSGGTGGNMFIDSGNSFTQLEENAFNKVVAKVDQIMEEKQHSRLPRQDGEICYSSSNGGEGMPQMVMHFADSADMVLPWDRYLWHSTKKATLCLAINRATGTGRSVLGNFQQQSIHMLFDTENDKLYFVPADCSKV